MVQYSQDDLKAAVLAATTWAEVWKALGYAYHVGGSTRQRIRNELRDLDIDVSHLGRRPGTKRSWTDADLRAAVIEASSWKDVYSLLRSQQDVVKAHAERLGLDVSHLDRTNHMSPPHVPPAQSGPQHEYLRFASEHFVAAYYAACGFDVFLPAPGMETKADLLALDPADGSTTRVQVKFASTVGRSGLRQANLLYGSRGSAGPRQYSSCEVDDFFVLTDDGTWYRIPFLAVEGNRSISLGDKYAKYIVAENMRLL